MMVRDHTGQTVLHHAVKSGSKEIVKYIIENGKSEQKGCMVAVCVCVLPSFWINGLALRI